MRLGERGCENDWFIPVQFVFPEVLFLRGFFLFFRGVKLDICLVCLFSFLHDFYLL